MSAQHIARVLPSYKAIKSILYRCKLLKYPLLPEVLSDLMFELGTKTEKFMLTYEGANDKYNLDEDEEIDPSETEKPKHFLLVDCTEDDQRIIIFSSDLQLQLMAKSRQLGVDGTFKSCPELFMQLYIIMGWCKGECMPVAFALLGGKKESTYRRMISELISGCRNLKLDLKPQRIIIDFEQGAISAFQYFFPLIEVFQKEEFLCVQFRTESLLIGTVTSKDTSKSDLEKDNVILKAKNKYQRSRKTFEDRVILLEECTCVVQNFLE